MAKIMLAFVVIFAALLYAQEPNKQGQQKIEQPAQPVAASEHKPPPELPRDALIEYYKAAYAYQKALTDQYAAILNSLQQLYSSPSVSELQRRQAALTAVCGQDAVLRGFDENPPNPRCVAK